MTSTTGRRPVIAAPTAAPTKPISAMGVSMTRSGPNSVISPRVARSGPPQASIEAEVRAAGGAGDILAQDDDGRVASHLQAQRLVDRLAEVELANGRAHLTVSVLGT